MSNYQVPGKIDLKPKKRHGYYLVLFILGTLLPPLAVAARFGIGKDFCINVLLTLCGYIPGHGHNFYIQNIRNNSTRARTPKWAQRYGLVDTSNIERKKRKSQWANRYNDRLPNSTLDGRPYEEGQDNGSSVDVAEGSEGRGNGQDLWRPEDENFYRNRDAESSTTSGGRWRYPANFDDVAPDPPKKKKKKEKKDRWARTEDAYSASEQTSRKKKKKKRSTVDETQSNYSRDESTEFPEDPSGRLYGNGHSIGGQDAQGKGQTATSDIFNHEL